MRLSLHHTLTSLSGILLFAGCEMQMNREAMDESASISSSTLAQTLRIESVSLAVATPTSLTTLPISYRIRGEYTHYCILANDMNMSNCTWRTGAPPASISPGADGPFFIALFLKETSASTPIGTQSNTVVVDTTRPDLASAAVTNSSPSATRIFNMTYGTVTGTYHEYCIMENNTNINACAWVSGTLPSTYTVSAVEGAKVLSVWLRTSAGGASTRVDTASVTLDLTTPTVASIAITNSNPTNTRTYSLSYGVINDSYSAYCILENDTDVNNCPWNLGMVPATFMVSATENSKSVTLWLKDAAGHVSTPVTSNSVLLDLTVPQLASAAITNPSPSPNNVFSLTYGAISDGPYSHYCIQENSTNVLTCIWNSGTLPASYTVNATEEAKILTIWIRDSAFNISTAVSTNSVTLDTTPPNMASLSIANANPTNTRDYTLNYGAITGTYSKYCILENDTNRNNCAWVTGVLPAAFETTTTENAKRLSLWLEDAAGNAGNRIDTSNIVTLDITVPVLGSATATGPATTSDRTFNLVYGSITNGPYVSHCILENNTNNTGCTWVAGAPPATYEVTAEQNVKTLSVWLKDDAGNISTRVDTNQRTLITSSPSIGTVIITNSNPTNSTTYNISYGSVVGVYYEYCILQDDTDMDNCTWTSGNLPASFVVDSAETAKDLSVWIRNGIYAPSARTTSNSVTLDTTAPSLASITITDSSPNQNQTFNLTYGAADAYASYCLLENTTNINTCSWITGTLPSTYIVNSANGSKEISAYIRDPAGNVSPVVTSNAVVFDNIPAVLASATISNPSPTHTTTFSLTFGTVTGTYEDYCIIENNTNVSSCSWVTGSLPASVPVAAVDENKVLSVWLRDEAGNVSTRRDTNTVLLDLINPLISLTSLTGGNFIQGGSTAAITWTASDANFDSTPIKIEVSTDSGASYAVLEAALANTGTYSWTVPTVDSATYRIRLTATDASTRSTTSASTSDFTIDNTNPAITLTSLTGGEQVISDSVIPITWTATDTNFGATPVAIAFSSDGGTTWSSVSANEVNDGTYSWTVPVVNSIQGRIRLTAVDQSGRTTVTESVSDFTIAIGSCFELAFDTQPMNSIAGAPISNFTVKALDSGGNLLNFVGDVTLTFFDNAGGSTITGTVTRTAAAGVATFDNIALDKIGENYAFRASTANTACFSGVSDPFNVTPNVPATIDFGNVSTPPSVFRDVCGAGILQFEVKDAYGNTVTNNTLTTWTVTLSSPTALGTTEYYKAGTCSTEPATTVLTIPPSGTGEAAFGRIAPLSDTLQTVDLTATLDIGAGPLTPVTMQYSVIAGGTWVPALAVVPAGRTRHAVAWSGSELLIWGGATNSAPGGVNTGSKYNIITDSWTPITTTGAPNARVDTFNVWTGSSWFIWGGAPNRNNGARYTPSTNTWSPIATVNAPSGRTGQPPVWTGTEIIIWGGTNGTVLLKSGARYNPTTNTWIKMEENVGDVPVARIQHTLTWLGNKLLVWGGSDGAAALGDGSIYDPSTNTWTAVTQTNAPSARYGAQSFFYNNKAHIFAGQTDGNTYVRDGAIFNVASGTWSAMTSAPVVDGSGGLAERGYAGYWTGSKFLAWGGIVGTTVVNAGAQYDPATDSWSRFANYLIPYGGLHSLGVAWDGSHLLFWGGFRNLSNDRKNWAFKYDPVTTDWTGIPWSSNEFPGPARSEATAVWTGSEMIVWGGLDFLAGSLRDGARYNPLTDTWKPMRIAADASGGLAGHKAIWTGSKMLICGGDDTSVTNDFYTGLYDPVTDVWTEANTTGDECRGRINPSVAWTGSQLVVWGGQDPVSGAVLNTGGKYNPTTDSWTPIASGPLTARKKASAIWTDSTSSEMIVWGGTNAGESGWFRDGARYHPGTDAWNMISTSNGSGAPSSRAEHAAVWTGSQMIIWGGYSGDEVGMDTGGVYTLSTNSWQNTTDPTIAVPSLGYRRRMAAIWSGFDMIIWGGDFQYNQNSGARYSPATGIWSAMSTSGAPAGRLDPAFVWTGSHFIIFGGVDSSGAKYRDVGRFVP